jgi:hypothetical protein
MAQSPRGAPAVAESEFARAVAVKFGVPSRLANTEHWLGSIEVDGAAWRAAAANADMSDGVGGLVDLAEVRERNESP